MMAQMNLPSAMLILPLLAVGAFLGYRRSWIRETVAGLLLAVILLGFDWLRDLVFALIQLVASLLGKLAAVAGMHSLHPEDWPGRIPMPLFSLACLVLFVAGAYWVGNHFGSRQPEGEKLHRSTGTVVGAVNVLLLLTIASKYLAPIVGQARLQNLPLVPGARGLSVQIPPFPSTSRLSDWSTFAMLILVAVAFVWGVARLTRSRG